MKEIDKFESPIRFYSTCGYMYEGGLYFINGPIVPLHYLQRFFTDMYLYILCNYDKATHFQNIDNLWIIYEKDR